jgi:PAS domain S-box-containing protein
VPVIFLSKQFDAENEIKGFEVGAADFIHVPISTPLLMARIKMHLKIKSLLEEKSIRTEQAETELNNLSALHRAIITTTDVGIMVFNENATCLLANEAAAKISGTTIEQMRHLNFRELPNWEISGMLEAAEETLKTGLPHRVDGPHISSAGKGYWCTASFGRIELQNGTNCVLVMFNDISEFKIIQQELINVSEKMLHRIGCELRDDLCQQLTGIAFMMEAQALRLHTHKEHHVANTMSGMMSDAIAKTRSIAHWLYPVELPDIGIYKMLQKLAEDISSTYHIRCTFEHHEDSPYELDDGFIAINIYRITQEAINDAVKHGQATVIAIKIRLNHKSLSLNVSDNGLCSRTLSEFKTPDQIKKEQEVREGYSENSAGNCIHSIQNRAASIGGSVRIEKPAGGGIRLIVTLPVANAVMRDVVSV